MSFAVKNVVKKVSTRNYFVLCIVYKRHIIDGFNKTVSASYVGYGGGGGVKIIIFAFSSYQISAVRYAFSFSRFLFRFSTVCHSLARVFTTIAVRSFQCHFFLDDIFSIRTYTAFLCSY